MGGDEREGAPIWNPNVGKAEDRHLGWGSLLLQKLDRILDRCSPESRRRSFEDPDRTLMEGEGSDSERRYNACSRAANGYDSVDSGERRAERVVMKPSNFSGSNVFG